MGVIIHLVDGYILKKDNPGWSVHVWKEEAPNKRTGGVTPAGYKPLGMYPHDIFHGIRIIADDIMTRDDREIDISELDAYVEKSLRVMESLADGLASGEDAEHE